MDMSLAVTNKFHIAFFAVALTIAITTIMFTLLQKRIDRLQNKFFLSMLAVVTINSITCTICAIAEPFAYDSDRAYEILDTGQFIYFLFHTALCPLLYYYVISVTGEIRKRSVARNMLCGIPLFVTEFLVLLNPILHCVYYYDSYLTFHRNWAEYLIYGAAALYFFMAMGRLLLGWNAITVRRRIALIYFFLISLAGVMIQLVNIEIKTELFAEALALMGAMIAVESEDDRIDGDTGIYNRRAMQMDIHNYLTMKEKVPLIFIKMINTELISRVTGSANDDDISRVTTDYLKTLVKRYRIYHPNPQTFVISANGFEAEALDALQKEIRERFEEGWHTDKTSFFIDAVVLRTWIPKDLSTMDDVFYIADCLIPANMNKKEVDISWLMWRSQVERTISDSVAKDAFEVYYQPIVKTSDLSIFGAEALVRMEEGKLGYISPDEFIPMAEQIGMVGRIDEFVLREVCEFIKSGVPTALGLKNVNVNLSVIQFLKPHFFEDLVDLVDSYMVDHKMLNFEITETVGSRDYHSLSNVVRKLKSRGFTLSLDDYGTGYSNMEAVFSLSFNVIKMDKAILWAAECEDHGRAILQNTIHMIHDMGYDVLIEGVEKEEHLELARKCNADYLQGYYFSKPIPKEDFITLIREGVHFD
ncbi:MAG: EAL domain-containing protein [Lachnospiraceae bacterium]|nr:EAL domain-containing protein [Lachnospiraceae bacterium]